MRKTLLAVVAFGLGANLSAMPGAWEKDDIPVGTHPCIVTTPSQKESTLKLVEEHEWARKVVEAMRANVDRYADKEEDYLSSRLYMNWKTQAKDVYIRGEWFSHVGEERAPVPTVMFSGARAGATGYARPGIDERLPYADETKGVLAGPAVGVGEAGQGGHPNRGRERGHHALCP